MADWIMIIITAVYVVATIFISYFNHQSAKATREQVSESVRQFNEANRAFITVTFECIRNESCVLHIHNHGKRIAENVNIKLNQDFIDAYIYSDEKERIKPLCSSVFNIGIGQSWYYLLFYNNEFYRFVDIPLNIEISYKDNNESYVEKLTYDLSQYTWAIAYNSDLSDISTCVNKLTKSVGNLEKTITEAISESDIDSELTFESSVYMNTSTGNPKNSK
jgi:hypothetical protein